MPDKILTVQIKPDLLSSVDPESVVKLLLSLAKKSANVLSSRVTRGNDPDKYVNVKFTSDNLPQLWRAIQEGLFLRNPAGEDTRRGTIVVCSGDSGWKDYLLLHHYESSQRLDSLNPKQKKPTNRKKIK